MKFFYKSNLLYIKLEHKVWHFQKCAQKRVMSSDSIWITSSRKSSFLRKKKLSIASDFDVNKGGKMFSDQEKAKCVLWYQQFNKSVVTVQRQYHNFTTS
jgi:hypothetical protein